MRFNKLISLVGTGAVLFLVGCGEGASTSSSYGGGGQTQPPAEPTEPVLVYPGSDLLPPLEPIVIDFNFPMDPGTLQLGNELAIHPLTVSWDTQTGPTILTITPTARWPAGTGQVLHVYCEDASGYYYFDGTIAYDVPPVPTASFNSPGSSDQSILVAKFSEPVDVDSLVLGGTLAAVATTEWSATAQEVRLRPSTYWPHGDRTISVEATSVAYHETVRASVSVHIASTAPSASHQPSENLIFPDQPLVATFTEAMDPASLTLSGTMAAETAGGVWSAGNKVLTISPTTTWSYGPQSITINVLDAQGDRPIWHGYEPSPFQFAVVDHGTAPDLVLTRPNGMTEPFFGASIAVEGTTAVVGATGGSKSIGAAVVYQYVGNTWVLQQVLRGSDTTIGSAFGYSVAISGGTIVVGAPAADPMGAVYVFVRNDGVWTEQTKLVNPASIASEGIGVSVAISGDTLLAGLPYRNGSVGTSQGAALLFNRAEGQWRPGVELLGSTTGANSKFGWKVALSDNFAIVAAPVNGNQTAAYAFAFNGERWTEEAVLVPSDSTPSHPNYVTSIALKGTTAVLGVPGRDLVVGPGGAHFGGAAYVFERQNGVWGEQQMLLASDGGGELGTSVGIDSDEIILGATRAGGTSGAAYTFVRSSQTWTQSTKLSPPEGGWGAGYSVAIGGGQALVGSPNGYATVMTYPLP